MSNSNSVKGGKMRSVVCLDVGNSDIKWAVKKDSEWGKITKHRLDDVHQLPEVLKKRGISFDHFLVSSVVQPVQKKLQEMDIAPSSFFADVQQIDNKFLDYRTPNTLGIDRYLACLGAWKESNQNSVVVIDAGTACTIDLMEANGVYRGGVIMPGLKLYERGLKRYAKALPQVDRKLPDSYPGKSTEECLKWGITGSFLGAIGYHLNRMASKRDNPELYVTGGDADLLTKYGRFEQRLNADKYLVMKGLLQHYLNFHKMAM